MKHLSTIIAKKPFTPLYAHFTYFLHILLRFISLHINIMCLVLIIVLGKTVDLQTILFVL